jgi:hypothetical protein
MQKKIPDTWSAGFMNATAVCWNSWSSGEFGLARSYMFRNETMTVL